MSAAIFPPQGRNLKLGIEVNNTPVAGANDTVLNTTNRYYTFFTMPTAAALYIVTGFEWMNGTVANGSVIAHLEAVDANPPVINGVVLLAFSQAVSQSGTSAVQRVSMVNSEPIPGGLAVGASIVSNSATGRYGTTTQGSANRLKALAFNSSPQNGNTTAWTAGTEEPYLKVYMKPLMIS